MRLSSRKIIKEAWEFTQNNKKLIIWYAFIPSILTTLVGILYLIYQYYAFKSSQLFENWEQSFTSLLVRRVLQIVGENFSGTFPFLLAAVIIVILYIIIPSFCEGAIIQLIARKKTGQEVRTSDGVSYGLLSFLPLFEYSWLVRTFSFFSILTWTGFIARNLGFQAFQTFLPIMIIFAVVGIMLTILFTYTEFFIVIDEKKVMESVTKSTRLVIMHLEQTLLLSILMLIISIRILLQILFVLLIPIIIIAVIYLIASSALPMFALIIGGLVGLILLYITAYLSGTIHVFAATVWTFTFLELTGEDQLDARGNVIKDGDDDE